MGSIRAVVFLVVGILLLIWGMYMTESIITEITDLVSGRSAHWAIWLLIGGTVLCIVGISGILKGRKGYGR